MTKLPDSDKHAPFGLPARLRQYHRALLSEQWVLLALARLYEEGGGPARPPDAFSEEHLHATLRWASAFQTDEEQARARSQANWHNRIIHQLGEYLLDQDPHTFYYRLSPYACELFQLLHATLRHEVRPTELVVHLRVLDEQLVSAAHFIDYADTHLPMLMNRITAQLQQARTNVRQEIRQLQQADGETTEDYLAHLTATNQRLQGLAAQTHELTESFARANEIKRKLNALLNTEPDNVALGPPADTLLQFIEQTYLDLRAQSAHIDRAQGLIQQLFKNIDAGRFNRLSEKFLRHLLREPTDSDPDPLGVLAGKHLGGWAMRYTFLRQTHRIYPPKRVKPQPPAPDPEGARLFREAATRQLRIAKQANTWLQLLTSAVDQGTPVDFIEFVQQRRAEPEFTADALLQGQLYPILAALLHGVTERAARKGWHLSVKQQEPPSLLPASSLTLWPLLISCQ